jgi:hypothetical protein
MNRIMPGTYTRPDQLFATGVIFALAGGVGVTFGSQTGLAFVVVGTIAALLGWPAAKRARARARRAPEELSE